MGLNLFNLFQPSWDVIPATGKERFIISNNPMMHRKMRAISIGECFPGNVDFPTFWPYYGQRAERREFNGILRGYWKPGDDTFFSETGWSTGDEAHTLLYPFWPWLTEYQQGVIRSYWRDIFDIEERYRKSEEGRVAVPNQRYTGVFFQAYSKAVRKLFTHESLYVPKFDLNNEELMNYAVPFWEHYLPEKKALIKKQFQDWIDLAHKSGNIDYELIDQTRVEFYRLCAMWFPWNDTTAQIYYPGYKDLTPALKERYKTLKADESYGYRRMGLNNSEGWNDISTLNLKLTFFEYQNSPSFRELHKGIEDYWYKLGQYDAAKFDAAFKQGYKDFFDSSFIPGVDVGISIQDYLKGTSILAKGLVMASAAVLTAGIAAPVGGAIATTTGVSAATGTVVTGAGVSAAASAVVGENPLTGVVDSLIGAGKKEIGDTINLGVDLTLPGTTKGETMGLFDSVQSFADNALGGIKDLSIIDAGKSVLSGIGDVGKLSTEEAFRSVGSVFSQITFGDVEKAMTPVAVSNPTEAANNSKASDAVSQTIASVSAAASENKAGIALVLGLAVVAYFALKGK